MLEVLPPSGGGTKAIYRCVCGTVVTALVRKVESNKVRSCGCLKSDTNRQRCTTHGGSKTPEYRVWWEMIQRCHNTDHPDYQLYGSRGITVCQRWRKSFGNFIVDMGPRPKGMTVERVNNDKGYSPRNCRWALLTDQANNRRDTVRITAYGKTMTLRQWSAETGISYNALRSRHQRGWDAERIVTFGRQA